MIREISLVDDIDTLRAELAEARARIKELEGSRFAVGAKVRVRADGESPYCGQVGVVSRAFFEYAVRVRGMNIIFAPSELEPVQE